MLIWTCSASYNINISLNFQKRGGSMGFKEFQKNLPVFSIGVVTKITQLSARQIRYYEE